MNTFSAMEEQVSESFVLSSMLYFRLSTLDLHELDPRYAQWRGLLHHTSRTLCMLCTAFEGQPSEGDRLVQGISDLVHSLRDAAELAERVASRAASAELQRCASRIEQALGELSTRTGDDS